MLFYIKKKCFSLAHYGSLVFMVSALLTAFQGGLLPIIGFNRILAWVTVGPFLLSSALSIVSVIVGCIAVLIMRFVIRNRILKESDLARIEGIAFTSPSIMQCEIERKASVGEGYACIPLVVFGNTGEVRDAVYLAVKSGMTVFGMYQWDIVPGYQFYYRFGGTL